MRRLHIIWPALLAGAFPAIVVAAGGSWVADAPAINAALSSRYAEAVTHAPPSTITDADRITGIRWRFTSPTAAPVTAKLCHPDRCTPLASSHGSTMGLNGLRANEPLSLRLRLTEAGPPALIKGIQVIINYRR